MDSESENDDLQMEEPMRIDSNESLEGETIMESNEGFLDDIPEDEEVV